MIASFTNPLAAVPTGPVRARAEAPSGGLMPWAAFRLLCLWTRSDPESVARGLGADGFDAGFGLGDRG